ncbi:MAG: hypothetical protein KKG47_09115 [Proteobacteria bacterium]|nr:hypothetical protein [Pseudomonadota bacterium]MBU1738348.1 hypothetical protein [Pseudomonadota bacterium]
MINYFGIPILLAVIAGIFFPYTALAMMPYAVVFLFVLMLLSGFTVDWDRVPAALGRFQELLLGLFLLFLFFPLLQLLLARLLISDVQIIEGVVFGSLMPLALVAPFFSRQLGGDEELAFLLMVLSTLLAPLLSPLLLTVLVSSVLPVRVVPFMKNMLLLVTVPLLTSFLLVRVFPKIRALLAPALPLANMGALSVLIFILFGSAAGRLSLGYESGWLPVKLLLLAFFQDFGVLFLTRVLAGKLFSEKVAVTMMVALSMKNVAIAASILLFYDPRAAIAPAMVFIAHACLFSFIPGFRKVLAFREEQ